MVKLVEILNRETPTLSPTQQYSLFIDLDGVLANFSKKAQEVTGISTPANIMSPKVKNDFWRRIEQHVKAGNKFFEEMEPTSDAYQLWNYIKKYHPIILSATGHIQGASEEKRMWVRKYFGHQPADEATFVRSASDKAKYAGPGYVLIDDQRKSIDPWIAAGGIGILHTTAVHTIYQLKELEL